MAIVELQCHNDLIRQKGGLNYLAEHTLVVEKHGKNVEMPACFTENMEDSYHVVVIRSVGQYNCGGDKIPTNLG